jgi:hypothetical protein
MSAETLLCIKKLNKLIKANVGTREAGEDIEDNSKEGSDEEDRDN